MMLNNRNKFEIIVTIVVTIWFFTTYYRADISFLVAMIITCGIVYYRVNEIESGVLETNSLLDIKLKGLLAEERRPPPRYLYIDPDLITFFDSIKDFRVYNRDSFVRTIKTTDNLLKIRSELENDFIYTPDKQLESWQNYETSYLTDKRLVPKEKSNIQNYKELFEAAESLGNKSLNYLQSFIIALPSSPFYAKKHKEALARFHVLIKRNLDAILFHCKEFSRDTRGILIGTDYGRPKPRNSKGSGGSFEFY